MRTAYRYCNVAALVILKINLPCSPPQLAASPTAQYASICALVKAALLPQSRRVRRNRRCPKNYLFGPQKIPAKFLLYYSIKTVAVTNIKYTKKHLGLLSFALFYQT